MSSNKIPAQWRNLICPQCQQPFMVRANQVDWKMRRGKTPCCSHTCASKLNYSGGIRKIMEHTEEIKRLKNEGHSSYAIFDILKKKGIQISRATVHRRMIGA